MNLSAVLSIFPNHRHDEMARRYAQRIPALRQKLENIYGGTDDFESWFSKLIEGIFVLASVRNEALQELDTERLQNPDWFLQQDMLGYCTYVDRFAGDLQGVKKRIPHLAKLGIRYLHLLPFFRARSSGNERSADGGNVGENDGGFAVSSFDEIEPRFGSTADLLELTAALREARISLCADFVLNHVADDHPWALAAKRGDPRYQAYFHLFPDRQIPDQFETTLGQIFPQTAPRNFSFNHEMQKWVWTTFYPYQWDLNYTNPEVFSDIALAMLRMANLGVEAFRLDSTAFLWKRLGTTCMNQAEAHTVLQALRDIAEIAAPGVLLKAEAIVATADLPAYLGEATTGTEECHIAYHSSLMASSWVALSEQKVDLIEAVIRATPALPPHASWLNYVRCHDDIGWNVLRAEASGEQRDPALALSRLQLASHFYSGQSSSFADGESFQASDPQAVHGTVGMTASLCGIKSDVAIEESLAIRRLLLMYGLAMSFGGIPLIYMGDEFGQRNDRSYLNDPARSFDGRWLQRPVLDAAALEHSSEMNLTSTVVYRELSALVGFRSQLSAFAADQPRRLITTGSEKILGFVRGDTKDGQFVICLMNFSQEEVNLPSELIFSQVARSSDIAAQAFFDVVANELMTSTITLPAYTQRWLRLVRG